MKEVRERIRKKDEVALDPKAAGGKGAPAGKGAPPAKGAPAKGAEAQQKNKRILPEPFQHVYNEIREFLFHFKSDRLIQITCDNKLL